MIPDSINYFMSEETAENFQIQPTKTYRIDYSNKRIMGVVDGPEAVMQFIRKTLTTDKYALEIYDWYYGNELTKLLGQSYNYVVTRIPAIIKEALLVDDRITGIRDFTFTQSSVDAVRVSCMVDTVYGAMEHTQEVPI